MRRPLEDRYWTTVAVVIAALAPYIVVTTAFFLVAKQQAADLHASPTALQISEGLSNAGYAFGALLGGDLIQRFRQRRLFFVFALPLAAGFLVSATATGLVQYACGHVLQGLATGFLLVVAVPPLVQRFPTSRMPSTTAMINIGFFGAVCAGPVVGGAVAHAGVWRWFEGGLAGVVLLASPWRCRRCRRPSRRTAGSASTAARSSSGSRAPSWRSSPSRGCRRSRSPPRSSSRC